MEHLWFFFKRLYHFSGKILFINMLGMVIVSLMDSVAILLLVPMIGVSGIIDIDLSSNLPAMFSWIVEIPKMTSLTIILGFYIVLVIFQNVLHRNLTIRDVRIQQEYSSHVRVELYQSLLHANWEFFIKTRKSDVINVMTNDLARVSAGINLILQLLASVIFTLIQIGVAFWLAPKITLFVLAAGLLLAIFSRKFIRKAKALGGKTSQLALMYLASVTDQINGIKDIKSYHLEKSHVNWIRSLTKEMNEEQVEYIKLNTTSQLSYKVSSALLIASFVFLSITLFAAQQQELLLILLIFSRLWPRFTGIQGNLEHISSTIPAFKSILKMESEAKIHEEAGKIKGEMPMAMKRKLEVQGLSFRYNKTETDCTLRNINLAIPANKMTAIVGPSGAGKSTLIDLLMGLMLPDKGKIILDGKLLSSQDITGLRRSISYVSQDPFLFNGSIKENMLMVDPQASDQQIWEALAFSDAADFVLELPHNLETIIGDRGIRLSGGERQRLVLARAILRKPSILILDEATSALDNDTEAKIQRAIENLQGSMTIIVIAHRLSTIRNADQVIVLEKGEILQNGDYKVLAREKGLFKQLLTREVEIM
ncbi:ABC transporter ATP-binding protein [Peribacillus muralis]|uniref:ABC transporter ATP-binding protein n=1 Tax=Peribacillus muralis TaxID=264697 RepID=UPI001F4EE899|nr:ABC transporter ATP-binding protein [Peribacillus muralis]MCK1993397.1 ABC transporter ATP-binding protein/permease [Peribacillus muralis]MCK2014315.1 ABC transporter ATP-binding protein/permease [Peribacillus muralis]